MKCTTLAAAFILASCGGTIEAPQAPPVPPIPPAAPVAAAATGPSVPTVVKHFDAAKAREMTVVLADGISASQISDIRQADQRARRALTTLGQERTHPTTAALIEAREAVMALERALLLQEGVPKP